MIEKLKNINFSLFAFFFIVCSTLIFFHPGNLNALEKENHSYKQQIKQLEKEAEEMLLYP